MTFGEQLNAFFGAHLGGWLLLLLALSLAAAGLGLIVLLRLAALMKPFQKLNAAGATDKMIPSILRELEANRAGLEVVSSELGRLREDSLAFFNHSGFVRYDAFEDVGGQQSYSLCLLDGRRNGYILTYLTGRNSTRSYAVQVQTGRASRELSDEEAQALAEAQTSFSS
jgi:hypothetical protein